tara:strand:- start:271 stop:861 length:591 start_codon:yes stop_codon:yes gene_type:complete
MSSIFILDNDEESNAKVNIDGLYEKRQKRDLKQISIFKKILNRIHKRIEYTSKNKKCTDTHIWFLVPEYLIGEPIYDKGECLGFIVTELQKNGFHVKYIHPNTLFISWHNWVPSYVRNEIKKKMGIIIDEKGNFVEKVSEEEELAIDPTHPINKAPGLNASKDDKKFVSVKDYKPTGNLLYSQDLLEKIEKKVNKN